MIKIVKKSSVERTLNTLIERHISDIVFYSLKALSTNIHI